MRSPQFAGWLVLVLGGCGTRSEPWPGEIDASVYVEISTQCRSDVDCADSLACTEEYCDSSLGVCKRRQRHDLCDDGSFCSGVESCDPEQGCLVRRGPCSDGIECTVDSCEEDSQECFHEPVDARCPPSHLCDVQLGCVQKLLVHDSANIYGLDTSTFELTLMATINVGMTDIALSKQNAVFVASSIGQVFQIDTKTGTSTPFAEADIYGLNGLDVGADGALYMSGASGVVRHAEGVSLPFAPLPPQHVSSGDIVVLEDGRALVSVVSTDHLGTDFLVEIDVTGTMSRIVGNIGYSCVYGLAILEEQLFGFTCAGQVLRIDSSSAEAELVTTVGVGIWGAAGR